MPPVSVYIMNKTFGISLTGLFVSALVGACGAWAGNWNSGKPSKYHHELGDFTDSDWNVTMYQGCGNKKQEIRQITDNGESFLRITLDQDSGVGGCASDPKAGRQRAEVQTKERMIPGKKYEFSAAVRFNKPIKHQAYFMQIHSKTGKEGDCYEENGVKSTPPVKLQIMENMTELFFAPGGWPDPRYVNKIYEVDGLFEVGKWTDVRILIDLEIGESLVSLFINDKQIFREFVVGTPNSCIRPWGKIGLFRMPYNIKFYHKWFDTKDPKYGNKFDSLSVDYDKVTLRQIPK